jgi:predicted lipid-binding transport protein (Tim44 family)
MAYIQGINGSSRMSRARFSGPVREEAGAAAEAFSEVWHLSKPVVGSHGWRIAGIQQC